MPYFTIEKSYLFIPFELKVKQKELLNLFMLMLENSGVGDLIQKYVKNETELGGRPNCNYHRLFAAILYGFALSEKKDIKLNRHDKEILNSVNNKIELMKKRLEIEPLFQELLGTKTIFDIVEIENPKLIINFNKEKIKYDKLINSIIDNAKNKALMSCFSKKNDSILMWSHYGKKHQGVCIEYDRPDSYDYRDVIYQKHRPTIKMYEAVSYSITLKILEREPNESEIAKYLKNTLEPFFINSKEWSYEKEVRCLYYKDDKSKIINSKNILQMTKPTAIYIGCKADGPTLSKLIQVAKSKTIPVYYMKKSKKTFRIVVDKERKA